MRRTIVTPRWSAMLLCCLAAMSCTTGPTAPELVDFAYIQTRDGNMDGQLALATHAEAGIAISGRYFTGLCSDPVPELIVDGSRIELTVSSRPRPLMNCPSYAVLYNYEASVKVGPGRYQLTIVHHLDWDPSLERQVFFDDELQIP